MKCSFGLPPRAFHFKGFAYSPQNAHNSQYGIIFHESFVLYVAIIKRFFTPSSDPRVSSEPSVVSYQPLRFS
jgi:hypothetical protein